MNLKEFWKYIIADKIKKKEGKEDLKVQKPKKKLGSFIILFILINSILGSSLFFLPGLGVSSSGAASIIAWIVLFAIATFLMLYIAELITLHPTSGGTYEFCKHAYGRFGSFIAGWLIWIAGNFGMALNIVAAAEYFIPQQTQGAFLMRMGFALLWIIVLNFMAFRGIDAGVIMLVVFGLIASFVVLAMTLPSFIDLPALFHGKLTTPFNLEMMRPFFRHDGIGILAFLGLSLFLICEAFFGFEVLSYMANEVKEVEKIPKILVSAMIICGVVTTIYIFSSLGTVGYHDYVNDLRPFAVQAFNTMGRLGQNIVVFGMYLVIIGAAAAWPITGSRLIRAMAGDGLFLEHFAVLHPKHNSPYRAVYFQTIMVALFSWFIFRGYIVKWGNPYRTIYLVYLVLSLLVLSLIILAVPILRKKETNLKRIFKAPLPRAGPILIVLLFIVLIWNWIRLESGIATSILLISGSFIVLGIPLYFIVEMFYDPKAIIKVNERLSFLVVLGEKIFFPFSIRNRILKKLKNLEGKTILEYGCSVGTLTKKLAPKIGPKGRIFATDLSLTKVKIADKRTKKIKRVSVHHHPYLKEFKLKLPKKVDNIISVGMLSYIQNPEKILSGLAKRVNKGGEIVFVDYDQFFWFIPNVKWIEDDKQLIRVFKKAGFKVIVERKNGLLWQYIIISGKKI